MVTLLTSRVGVKGLRILDAGCGEGKNAVYLAQRGAHVIAIDVSSQAISNALSHWPSHPNITWSQDDITQLDLGAERFDIVIAYGLLHCMANTDVVFTTIRKIQNATVAKGYNILVALNDRFQDLSGHPGFAPCLVAHSHYIRAYDPWELLHASDSNLTEIHPHNRIPHTHSITRLLARSRQ